MFFHAQWMLRDSFPVAGSSLKQRLVALLLGDAGDNACPEGERVELRS